MADSDSDDDDMLDNKSPVFTKTPSRLEQKKSKAEDDCIDQYIASGEAFCTKRAKLGEIGAYKESDDKILSEQVQTMSQSNCIQQKKILNGLTGLYDDDNLPEEVLKDRIASVQACRRERYGERHFNMIPTDRQAQ
jgi:hypothetical protein